MKRGVKPWTHHYTYRGKILLLEPAILGYTCGDQKNIDWLVRTSGTESDCTQKKRYCELMGRMQLPIETVRLDTTI